MASIATRAILSVHDNTLRVQRGYKPRGGNTMRSITRMIELINQARVLSMDIPDDGQNKVVDQLIGGNNITQETGALTDLLWYLAQDLMALKIEYVENGDRYYIITAVDSATGQKHTKRPIFAEDDSMAAKMATRYYNLRTFPTTETIKLVAINPDGTHTYIATLQETRYIPNQKEEIL
jgi:hypothetical protein